MYEDMQLVYEAISLITSRYTPEVRVIKDWQGHELTEPVEAKQIWRQYFDTFYNDTKAVNFDYNEKYFSSLLNTRDD